MDPNITTHSIKSLRQSYVAENWPKRVLEIGPLHTMPLCKTGYFNCMISLPEYSWEFTVCTCFFAILLRASTSINTNINTTTISTTMTIATIVPSSSREPTGGEVVSGGGRNGVGLGVEGAENCTGASVCGVLVVCKVPVWVIMGGGGWTVARIFSTESLLEEVEGEGDGVCEGGGVDTATKAVMIGAAVVDERKS